MSTGQTEKPPPTYLQPQQARRLLAAIELDLEQTERYPSHVFGHDMTRLHRIRNAAEGRAGRGPLVSKLHQIDTAMGWAENSALYAALNNTPPVRKGAQAPPPEPTEAAQPSPLVTVDTRHVLVVPRRVGPPPAGTALSHLVVRVAQAMAGAPAQRLAELSSVLYWWLEDGKSA